jgi:hypothetical protein
MGDTSILNVMKYYREELHIRSVLHKNYFFEIQAYRFYDDGVIQMDTTRYDYKSDVDKQRGYYVYQSREKEERLYLDRPSVVLYVAKRGGNNIELTE